LNTCSWHEYGCGKVLWLHDWSLQELIMTTTGSWCAISQAPCHNQCQFWYYVKHAQGVSAQYNQHMEQDPWYGAGQVAGNACPHWIVQANSMIMAYHTHANPWILYDPTHITSLQLGFLDAFVDDMESCYVRGLPHPTPTYTTLSFAVQEPHIMVNLFQASGSILNPSKYVWFIFLLAPWCPQYCKNHCSPTVPPVNHYHYW